MTVCYSNIFCCYEQISKKYNTKIKLKIIYIFRKDITQYENNNLASKRRLSSTYFQQIYNKKSFDQFIHLSLLSLFYLLIGTLSKIYYGMLIFFTINYLKNSKDTAITNECR